MGRAILAVVLGYVIMFVVTFVVLTGAYLALGTDGSFKPGSYEPSTLWLATMFVVGLVAALAGGYGCAAIARSPRPAMALAGIVFVLGLVMAIPALIAGDDRPLERPDELTSMEAMQNARQPGWVALVHPFLGAVGVIVGSKLRRVPTP